MTDEKPDLIEWVIDNANSLGEDFNDGDEHPGWLTSEWVENGNGEYDLFVTYENPANEVIIAKYRIQEIGD